MTRQIKIPTQLSLKVSAKKLGATTRRRIRDPGISSQSAESSGNQIIGRH
jgi:hypothetical protein